MGRRPGPNRRPHRSTDWMDEAACATAPTELFHPTPPEEWPGGSRTPERIAAYHQLVDLAIQDYCMECPVRAACREYGKDEEFGIWGGLSELDRRAERRIHRPWRSFGGTNPQPETVSALRMRLLRLRQSRAMRRLGIA